MIKSLPGYGNAGLKKKEIKAYVKEKPFIKVWMVMIRFLVQKQRLS